MSSRKLGSAVEARECLAAVAASGLSRAEWARRNGVDARSLNAWRLNLGERRPAGREPAFVELVTTSPVPASRYAVRVGDLVVEVDEHFDDRVLRRLLHVVASC